MHTTSVTLFNGEKVSGWMYQWRPEEGFFELVVPDGDKRTIRRIDLDDVQSAATEEQRVSRTEIRDDDLIARAIRDGWTPKSR